MLFLTVLQILVDFCTRVCRRLCIMCWMNEIVERRGWKRWDCKTPRIRINDHYINLDQNAICPAYKFDVRASLVQTLVYFMYVLCGTNSGIYYVLCAMWYKLVHSCHPSYKLSSSLLVPHCQFPPLMDNIKIQIMFHVTINFSNIFSEIEIKTL